MRLTKRIDEHVYYTTGKYPETLPAECETNDIRTILRCLAAYEDIGLDPDEIKSLIHDGGIGIAMRRRETETENERLKSELAAAVEDLAYFAGAITTGEPCNRCQHNPNDVGCELDGSQFDDDGECHFEWRGPSIV